MDDSELQELAVVNFSLHGGLICEPVVLPILRMPGKPYSMISLVGLVRLRACVCEGVWGGGYFSWILTTMNVR